MLHFKFTNSLPSNRMAFFSAHFLLLLGHLTRDFLACVSSLFPWYLHLHLVSSTLFFTSSSPKCRPFSRFYSQTNSFLTLWPHLLQRFSSIISKVYAFPICGQTSLNQTSQSQKIPRVKTHLLSPTWYTFSLFTLRLPISKLTSFLLPTLKTEPDASRR